MPDSNASPDLLAPLERFLLRSRELLALAEADDWETFETRLAEREAGLPALGENQFIIDVAKAGREDEMREAIAEIQAINDQLVTLAEQSKADIARHLKTQQTKDKAVKAYKGS